MTEVQTDKQNDEIPVEIEPNQLSKEALSSIIEYFVLREGTDYGANEISLDVKVKQVESQIAKGQIKIVFDLKSETIGLIDSTKLNKIINKRT